MFSVQHRQHVGYRQTAADMPHANRSDRLDIDVELVVDAVAVGCLKKGYSFLVSHPQIEVLPPIVSVLVLFVNRVERYLLPML